MMLPVSAGVDLEGRLDRPVASDQWTVPAAVNLRGDCLVWEDTPSQHARQKPGLLEKFLALANASDEGIRDFARRWGVLGICEHGLPASHNPRPIPLPTSGSLTWCRPLGTREGKPQEPVEIWRRYSRQMGAVLRIADRLHDDEPGRREDWRVVFYQVSHQPVPWWKPSVAHDRMVVSQVLGEWLDIAHVRLECHWNDKKPGTRVCTRALFGALVVQLVTAVSRTDGLAMCSGCGLSYIPERRPRADQRRYCPECRTRHVPERDASADYRRRRRSTPRRKRGSPIFSVMTGPKPEPHSASA